MTCAILIEGEIFLPLCVACRLDTCLTVGKTASSQAEQWLRDGADFNGEMAYVCNVRLLTTTAMVHISCHFDLLGAQIYA